MVDVNELDFHTADAPYVIRDEMDATRHMGDGKHYTSKKKFREATRAAGCVEIGNEVQKPRPQVKLDQRKRVDDIRQAIYQLKNR
jgi:hypothetical protein